jgi:hypothetical protein
MMNPAATIKIGVVLGSGRKHRLGDRVTRFVLTSAKQVPEAEFALFDLASYQLPFRLARIIAQILPYMLRELARYAAALRPLRQEMAAWEKPWRD